MKKSGRPQRKREITYEEIANILGTTQDYVRQLESNGEFNIDDTVSICKFITGKLLIKEAKK